MSADTVSQYISSEVRAELARQRTTQLQVGEWLGLNQQAVSRRVTGHVSWTFRELVILSMRLGKPVSQLAPPLAEGANQLVEQLVAEDQDPSTGRSLAESLPIAAAA